MDNAPDTFDGLLGPNSATISRLKASGITLIQSFPPTGKPLAPGAAAFLQHAFNSVAFDSLPSPAVIDAERAAVAWNALGRSAGPGVLRQALLRGRLRLQGTDGVRGLVNMEVDAGPTENPILRFGRTSEITYDLMYTLCFAFGALAKAAGVATAGSRVILANDSRDRATGWRLVGAAKRGFSDAGLSVLDLGVAPTPAVPFAQAATGVRLGASITASHNPSNQNGIKFFVDGFKVLPEGPLGDYALSAAAWDAAQRGIPPYREPVCEDASGLLDAFADFIVANVPDGAAQDLRGLDILVDCANGAFAGIVRIVSVRLGIFVDPVNRYPLGVNINLGGGVAQLEGRDKVSFAETRATSAFGSMHTLLNRVNSSGRPCYAVVLDGDGDRGYLAFSLDGQTASIVDGDAESFIIARYMRESGLIPPADAPRFEFVGTVESDLELFRAVHDRLALATTIGCVGDKWLVKGYREGRSLAIAEEYSGHVLWPAKAVTPSGAAEVLSGNGLLTGLYALVAALRLGLSPAELSRPFPRGTFATRCVYNVNKALFFPGSAVWSAALECIKSALDTAPHAGFHSWRVIEMPDEPDMLYVGLQDERGALLGTVFVRNSGTENKTCIYARGVKSLELLLTALCEALWQLHRRTMKDFDCPAFKMETAVLAALERGPLGRDALAAAARPAIPGPFSSEDFDAVLYGMLKEGLLSRSGANFLRTVLLC